MEVNMLTNEIKGLLPSKIGFTKTRAEFDKIFGGKYIKARKF
jgi:hypothetical protein